jgi:hypothetical protein
MVEETAMKRQIRKTRENSNSNSNVLFRIIHIDPKVLSY